MDTSLRSKRERSLSSSSSSSSIGSNDSERSETPPPPPKFHRASPSSSSSSKPFTCFLPPTCSQPSTFTSYATQAELDRHQETFHRWVCRVPVRDRQEYAGNGKGKGKAPPANTHDAESGGVRNEVPETFVGGRVEHGKRWKECNKVFPEERLLALHHTEVHDPIARQKQDDGGKIFECFLPPSQCGRTFLNPNRRRKHLIDKHKYPHQYFFGITNHGLNEIVRQDGLAISMIRPRRDPPQPMSEDLKGSAPPSENPPGPKDNDGNDGAGEGRRSGQVPLQVDGPDVDMDDLTSKMGRMESSLSFVPRGVRKAQAKAKGKMEIE